MSEQTLQIYMYMKKKFAWKKLANYRLFLGPFLVGGSEKEKGFRTWKYEVRKQELVNNLGYNFLLIRMISLLLKLYRTL